MEESVIDILMEVKSELAEMKLVINSLIKAFNYNRLDTREYSSINENITTIGKDSFLDFMDREINDSRVKNSTKEVHRNFLRLLKQEFKNIYFSDISVELIAKIEKHLLSFQKRNTVAKNLKVMKKYLNIAVKYRYISSSPFDFYKIQMEQTSHKAITSGELKKLEDYRRSLENRNEYLDAFLFACYTGLRFSDLIRVEKKSIKAKGRGRWLIIETAKTGREVRIPISSIFDGKALEISKSIPYNRGCIFRLQSNQKLNYELARISKIIGINRITIHQARHTCATLLLHYGVSITTVQTILGHRSVVTTQCYSEITDSTVLKEIKKVNRRKKN